MSGQAPALPAAAAIGRAVIKGLSRTAKTDASLKPLYTTHENLKRCIEQSLPGRQLYAFGSINVYGFMESGSDVDFVVLDPQQVRDGTGLDDASQTARALQAHALSRLAKTMRVMHKGIRIDEVKRTRVPVLRCAEVQPPRFPVPFDVTADRRNGVRNSWLLRAYFDQHPEARWLAMAVKRWSKQAQLNGSTGGFLTSYAFNILVVHYYRARLNKMAFVPLSSADVAAVPQLPTGLPLTKPTDMRAFGNDVVGFFDYYLNEFDYANDVVTLSRPEPTSTQSLGWTLEKEDALKMQQGDVEGGGKVSYRFCIEDPFEVNLNVGRNVSAFRLDLFRQHLAAARATGFGWLAAAEEEVEII